MNGITDDIEQDKYSIGFTPTRFNIKAQKS